MSPGCSRPGSGSGRPTSGYDQPDLDSARANLDSARPKRGLARPKFGSASALARFGQVLARLRTSLGPLSAKFGCASVLARSARLDQMTARFGQIRVGRALRVRANLDQVGPTLNHCWPTLAKRCLSFAKTRSEVYQVRRTRSLAVVSGGPRCMGQKNRCGVIRRRVPVGIWEQSRPKSPGLPRAWGANFDTAIAPRCWRDRHLDLFRPGPNLVDIDRKWRRTGSKVGRGPDSGHSHVGAASARSASLTRGRSRILAPRVGADTDGLGIKI